MKDTITLPRAVVEQVMEALEYASDFVSYSLTDAALGMMKHDACITVLSKALEQTQEKYTWGTPLLDAMTKEYKLTNHWGQAAKICWEYHQAGGTAWDCWNALRMLDEENRRHEKTRANT